MSAIYVIYYIRMQNILPKDRIWRYTYKFKNDSNEIKAHELLLRRRSPKRQKEREIVFQLILIYYVKRFSQQEIHVEFDLLWLDVFFLILFSFGNPFPPLSQYFRYLLTCVQRFQIEFLYL